MIRDRYPMFYKGHPRLYFKRKPIFWWTKKWAHTRFIIRELTSLGVAFFAVIIIIMVSATDQGQASYTQFQAWMTSPLGIVLNMLAFLLVMYHTITWFNLAPKAMVIKVGTYRIPGFIIKGLNYGALVIVSVAILWLVLN